MRINSEPSIKKEQINAGGIYGGGDTVEEAKQSILDAIQIIKDEFTPDNIPTILKGDYEIV